MALLPWVEAEAFDDGRPRPFTRFRYIHDCGKRGKWTDATAAQIGYRSHDRHCTEPPLVNPGGRYRLQYVGAGHDVWVLAEAEQAISAHSPENWLLRDTDDIAGAQRLMAFVERFGGLVVNKATFEGSTSGRAQPASHERRA